MILDCNEIIQDRLWVGRYIRPDDVEFLSQLGISAVVNLQSSQDLLEYHISMNKLFQVYSEAGIDICHIPIMDSDREALSANLPEAVIRLEELLRPSGSKVYVHCTAGINRGPTLVAAYLMKTYGLSSIEAYDHVRNQRRCDPFISVLDNYKNYLEQI